MAASAPFKNRELNGELLLEELADLRLAQVRQQHLEDAAAQLRPLRGRKAAVAAAQLKAIASARFAGQPALASLLVRWSGKLKTDLDVGLLADHLERLALTAAVVEGLKQASARLPKSGR